MRHNNNARRMHGRGNGGGRSGGGHGGGHHHNNGGQQGNRRVNPRVQTFDSNGPEVRIRGTAYQINEKYVALARDAASAGDRILAESYLQHAEHYQRFINEMTEEFNQYNQQNPQYNQQPQPQPSADGTMAQPVVGDAAVGGMNDLDQGFLVGPRHGHQPMANGGAEVVSQPVVIPVVQAGEQGEQQPLPQRQQRGERHYTPRRGNDTETV